MAGGGIKELQLNERNGNFPRVLGAGVSGCKATMESNQAIHTLMESCHVVEPRHAY